jgi:hypothetical protein
VISPYRETTIFGAGCEKIPQKTTHIDSYAAHFCEIFSQPALKSDRLCHFRHVVPELLQIKADRSRF